MRAAPEPVPLTRILFSMGFCALTLVVIFACGGTDQPFAFGIFHSRLIAGIFFSIYLMVFLALLPSLRPHGKGVLWLFGLPLIWFPMTLLNPLTMKPESIPARVESTAIHVQRSRRGNFRHLYLECRAENGQDYLIDLPTGYRDDFQEGQQVTLGWSQGWLWGEVQSVKTGQHLISVPRIP